MLRPLLALALLLPAPSIGTAFGMALAPGTPLGVAVFIASKIWIVALPIAWHLWVTPQDVASLRPARRGLGVGLALGLAISAAILLLYALIGSRFLDNGPIAEKLNAVGFTSPLQYVALASYWILVNSVIEEYVWRWFVTQQFEKLVRPVAAVALSALAFTIHHIVALQTFLPGPVVAAAAAGIFIGGVAWSACYIRYRSIWPGYLSHAVVDLAVFGVGYTLVFGTA